MSGSKVLRRAAFYPVTYWDKSLKAKWTGEFRQPKKGEWYLSGSNIAAYQAPNDLTMSYHIAKLVRVRKVEYWEEVNDEV